MRNNIGSLEVLIISTYRFRALTFLEGISLNSLDAIHLMNPVKDKVSTSVLVFKINGARS